MPPSSLRLLLPPLCVRQLGKVDQVSPFRTTFVSLTDKKVPWTIPNGDIMRLSISNRSRINSTV